MSITDYQLRKKLLSISDDPEVIVDIRIAAEELATEDELDRDAAEEIIALVYG